MGLDRCDGTRQYTELRGYLLTIETIA